MASRNIANMHLFLEMKRKFPDLPEDTLRNYVLLYAEDQNKCISMLQKESKNHFRSSKKFPEFHTDENRSRHKKYQNITIDSEQSQTFPNSNTLILKSSMGSEIMTNDIDKPQSVLQKRSNFSDLSTRSTINLPLKPSNLNIPVQHEAKSAPVLTNNNKPFTNVPSSQTSEMKSRMMFSTTKEHAIVPPANQNHNKDSDDSPRHAVKLSITPSFPFPQQQMSVYTSTVSTPVSHTSKPGRHTTSLNLQLQDRDSYPVEISTIPTNVANSPCNSRDFASHLQISVGAQGATFTALRLQRPQPSVNVTSCSSQPQDSKVYKFSATERRQVSDPSGNDSFSRLEYNERVNQNWIPKINIPNGSVASQSSCNSFQASSDYVQAVKIHQLARLDLVREELNKEMATCSKLKSKVNALEQEKVRCQDKKNSFSYDELLKKIKEENRKLRIECNCLLMEYDISSKGQIPVGMTDEDFYSNIFTGPNDLALHSKDKKVSEEKTSSRVRKMSADEDESNRWKCKKCTFANHPALEKCEMCELPRNSGYLEYNPNNYSTSSHLSLMPSSQRRAVGSVQISVTRRMPSIKLQLTHRMPR